MNKNNFEKGKEMMQEIIKEKNEKEYQDNIKIGLIIIIFLLCSTIIYVSGIAIYLFLH